MTLPDRGTLGLLGICLGSLLLAIGNAIAGTGIAIVGGEVVMGLGAGLLAALGLVRDQPFSTETRIGTVAPTILLVCGGLMVVTGGGLIFIHLL